MGVRPCTTTCSLANAKPLGYPDTSPDGHLDTHSHPNSSDHLHAHPHANAVTDASPFGYPDSHCPAGAAPR